MAGQYSITSGGAGKSFSEIQGAQDKSRQLLSGTGKLSHPERRRQFQLQAKTARKIALWT